MPVTHTLRALARDLDLQLWGDGDIAVSRLAEPAHATADSLALAMKPDYARDLGKGAAMAALLWEGADPTVFGLKGALLAARPRHALSGLSALFETAPLVPDGPHPTAVIDPSATIGSDCAIGPFAVISAGVILGARAQISAHVTIGADSRIGDDAIIAPRVSIAHGVSIGDRVRIASGTVIGSDGFSFVTPEASAVENVRKTLGDRGDAGQQRYVRIHSLGGVRIGDDVEFGANCTVDRGTVADTTIGDRAKLDNQVHIAHNVRVGADALLCGQSGIAGSSVVGDRLVLGGQSGISDNLKVGDDVVIAGATVVRSNQATGRVVMGDPALPMEKGIEVYKALHRLPRLVRQVAELRKALSKGGSND